VERLFHRPEADAYGHVVLNDADFHTAEQMASAIDGEIGQEERAPSTAADEIAVNPDEDVADCWTKVESVEVEVYPRARVVVNEPREGRVGGTVRLQPVSISMALVVNVISTTEYRNPMPCPQAHNPGVQQTSVQAQDRPVNRIDLKAGATVEDLSENCNVPGGARDVISILQAMKEAGALEADWSALMQAISAATATAASPGD